MLKLIAPDLFDSATPSDYPPALRAMLARGQLEPKAPASLAESLCRAFGIERDCPAAALTMLDDGSSPGEAYCLRADPVHLHINIDKLVLTDPGMLELDMDEARALADSINRHFAADGLVLLPLKPDRWYCKLDSVPDMRTSTLPHVIGQAIDKHLPEGEEARKWRGLINEIQMLLHGHPVNTARESRGLPTINSLWFWGGGRLPTVERAPFSRVFGNSPSVRALTERANLTCAPLPQGLVQLEGPLEDTLLVLDASDAMNRESAMAQLESLWFAPLLEALKFGRLDTLELIGHVRLNRWQAWCLWQR